MGLAWMRLLHEEVVVDVGLTWPLKQGQWCLALSLENSAAIYSCPSLQRGPAVMRLELSVLSCSFD